MDETRGWLRASAYRLIGAPPATALGLMFGRSSLRVLGFHGILDGEGFRQQMAWLIHRCTPVTAAQVVGAFSGEPLPARAVWVTFDDGDPSVVEIGLPVLNSFEVRATMFICPGVVGTSTPFWWQVIGKGIEVGVAIDERRLTALDLTKAKQVPDEVRRRMVDQVREQVESIVGAPFRAPQLSKADLESWVKGGHSLGNHSWDHPVLDRCTPDEQHRQIGLAHEWIVENVDPDQLLFAYPNGNWTAYSEALLRQFGYQGAALFDHRLADLADPLRISRLRTNADGRMPEFRAAVSGTHPVLHRLLGRS